MDWKLNKEQIAEVAAMYTELCEEIPDKEISLNLSVRKDNDEYGKVVFIYDVYAIFNGKIIYINMGEYRSLMDSSITNVEVEKIIDLLKGNE
nr:MAG TPA: hypothetical protein [Caudoviricetes sp.]